MRHQPVAHRLEDRVQRRAGDGLFVGLHRAGMAPGGGAAIRKWQIGRRLAKRGECGRIQHAADDQDHSAGTRRAAISARAAAP
jgi:hypothetical protein